MVSSRLTADRPKVIFAGLGYELSGSSAACRYLCLLLMWSLICAVPKWE